MTTSSSPVLTTACQTPAGDAHRVSFAERDGAVVELELAGAGDDVGDLLGLVADGLERGSRREDRVAEGASLPLRQHPRPAAARQLDRLDVVEIDDVYGSTHSPSLRM